MTTRAGYVLLSSLLLSQAVGLHRAFADAGEAGFSFLKLGVSGRGMAMADAMSASIGGAAATHYNPAGVLSLPADNAGAELMFMHREWIQDTRTEFLGAAVRIGEKQALGVSLNSTTVSDIEIRTRPGDAEGTFTARNFLAGLTYAREFTPDIRAGATVKFLYQKILIDESSGFGVDLGAQYRTALEGLSVGAVVSNLGTGGTMRNETTRLPALLRAGAAYRLEFADITSTLSVASDYVRIFPERLSFLNLGGELEFQKMVAARLGYQFGSEGRGFSAGIGLTYGMLTLDYAFAPLVQDLGNSHTFSLAIAL